jgi:pimeloyl-ACP methyl ester carboxylesterase
MYALFDPMSLPGGVRLPYVESGDRDGTPVLMLHGLGESRRSFDPVRRRLPESIRAVAATQRGHGDAAKPVAGYRLEHYVGDAVALLDRLQIDRTLVVGHAFGARVAERLAIEHPDRVGGLLLTGAAGRAEQAALPAAIPGAGLSVYEGTGHTPHREQPQRFADELTSFVASCRAGRDVAHPRCPPAGRAASSSPAAVRAQRVVSFGSRNG